MRLLENKEELKIVDQEVDPYLQITEIADRVMKKTGPALLFKKVKGSEFPLLINAYGSYQRMPWALGVEDIEEQATRIKNILKTHPPKAS